LFVVFPLTVFLGKTKSADKLTSKRPSVGLFSWYNASSIIAHLCTAVAWQYLILQQVRAQSDYYVYANDKFLGPWSMESTATEYFISFQYIAMTFVFAWGRPFKQYFITNWKLSLWLAVVITTSLLMVLIPQPQHYPTGATAISGSHLRSSLLHVCSMFPCVASFAVSLSSSLF
jgi:magnesium-transporting ATPase (P-type)